MIKFIFWTGVFVIVGGLLLHYKVDLFWLKGWLGKLPGDMTVQKDKILIYFPISSAALCSLTLSFFLYFVFKK